MHAERRSLETDRVETTVVIHYGSPNLAPNKTRPTITEHSARQRDFGLRGVIHKYGGSPRSDQSTTSDKNKFFHALDAQSVLLCPAKPADYMISGVILETFCADDVFAVAPVGKKQKCTAIPEPVRGTSVATRMSGWLRLSGKGP